MNNTNRPPISKFWTVIVMLTGVLPYFSGGLIPLIIWCMPIYVFSKFEIKMWKKVVYLLFNSFLSLVVAGLLFETKYNITLGI